MKDAKASHVLASDLFIDMWYCALCSCCKGMATSQQCNELQNGCTKNVDAAKTCCSTQTPESVHAWIWYFSIKICKFMLNFQASVSGNGQRFSASQMRLWHSPCQRTPLGCNLLLVPYSAALVRCLTTGAKQRRYR